MQFSESHRSIVLEGTGETHYVTAGRGAPLLLLHGLGESVVAWRSNISVLAERYAVYAPDLPGHGDSAKPDITYDLDAGVRFVLQFMEALRLEGVVLMGNSMGGLTALATVLRHPDRTKALVLVDSPGLGRELAWQIRLVSLPGVGILMEALKVKAGLRIAPAIFHRPERMEPIVYEELQRLHGIPELRRAVLSALRNGVNLLGLRPPLRLLQNRSTPLPVPTLVVWGREDRVIPVAHAERIGRQVPGVQVRILPDCGHWPQMEQAEAFNEAVLAFLEATVTVKEEQRGL